MRATTFLLLSTLGLAACGGDDDDDDVVPDAGLDAAREADAGADAGAPTARLEVHARGTDTAVDRFLFTDPLDVVVSEAPPDTEITVRGHRLGWLSEAVFTTDAAGSASTLTSSSTGGTYTGVEPDGLFWSMQPVEDEEPDLGATMDFEVAIDGVVVDRVVLSRLAFTEGVTFVEVDDPAIVGTLYLPSGEGPFPAMLVFGGSEGGTLFESVWGPILASKGYATLGVAYFGAEGVPEFLDSIPLEYFGGALAWLGARPEVDPERIGVLGASRGGELALLLGAHFPSIQAVVAGVPSGLVWPGIHDLGLVPAWTFEGAPLPYMPGGGLGRTEPGPDDSTIHIYREAFEESLEFTDEDTIAAATIHVEDTAGPILMLAGDADQLWPSCTLAAIAADRLTPVHAQTFADDSICFPEAGHIIAFPGLPSTDKVANGEGSWLGTGGSPQGNGHAAREGFDRTLEFLDTALGAPSL